MSRASEEFTRLPKAVEYELDKYCTSIHGNAIKWQRSQGPKSQVVKINKRVREGDFTISGALVKLALPEEQNVKSFIQHLKVEGEKWVLPIKDVSMSSKGFLSISLQRTPVFQRVMSEVISEGDNYGCRLSEGCGHDSDPILINNSAVSSCGQEDVSLNVLRCILFGEQLKNILQKLGFNVHEVTHHLSTKLQSISRTFQLQSSLEPMNQETRTKIEAKLCHRALSCRYRVFKQSDAKTGQNEPDVCDLKRKLDDESNKDIGDRKARLEDESLRNCGNNYVSLDLQQFVTDSDDLELGKGKYDKNIHIAKVTTDNGEATSILQQCAGLEENCPKTSNKVIHIATKTKAFHQQQVDLTWRMLSDSASTSQLHVVCGPVLIRQSGDHEVTVEEFYRIREAQTREASVMKYGEEVRGDGWNEVIQNLTNAGIQFELLGMQHSSQIKLDVSDSRENASWPDSRDGVFVMYNYARLATLFSNYDKEVKNGVYPALPCISSIDWSVLRDDHEWGLVFNHILQYPTVLDDIRNEIMINLGPKVNLQTHKICGFLVSLSRDLSSYYSHVHILGGNHAHLLSVMFARLYLMKAVQQVLRNGLALLNIKPLQQM